jgi:hypothetical protein
MYDTFAELYYSFQQKHWMNSNYDEIQALGNVLQCIGLVSILCVFCDLLSEQTSLKVREPL